jgi:hypothetical protein
MTGSVSTRRGRGEDGIQTAPKLNSSNAEQRRFSDKMEALYNAKRVARDDSHAREKLEAGEASKLKSRRDICDIEEPRHPMATSQHLDLMVSEVRNLFDGNKCSLTMGPRIPWPATKSSRRRIAAPKEHGSDQPSTGHLITPPRPPPGRALNHPKILKNFTPPTSPKLGGRVKAPVPKVLVNGKQSIPESGKLPKLRNRGVEDKIKLVEISKQVGVVEGQVRIHSPQERKDSIQTRKGGSRKAQHTCDARTKEQTGLSVRDVPDIVQEFQKMEGGLTVRRDAVVGGWNKTLTVTSRGGLDGKAGEMIVKEAECGLKQPKPVRLVELKSMIWMCRGVQGYKEQAHDT